MFVYGHTAAKKPGLAVNKQKRVLLAQKSDTSELIW